ncbi:MAG: glycosyltransferase, partial [Spirochaetaceae bacterium]
NGTPHDQPQQQFLNYLLRFDACAANLPRPQAVCMLFVFPVAMDGQMVAAFRQHGAEVRSLGASRALSLRSLYAAWRVMRAFQPDIIHSQHAIAGIHARIAGTVYRVQRALRRRRVARARRVRIIAEQRNARHGLSRIARTLERLTFPLAGLILCSSPGVEQSWFGGPAQQIDPARFNTRRRRHYTFFNSIDIGRLRRSTADLDRTAERRRLGLAPGRTAVVTVASLTRQKNYPLLLRAVAALSAAGSPEPPPLLLCIGEGGQQPLLRRMIADLGLQDTVKLLGYRTDIDRVLFACDIFVLASRWEGLAKALLEAMSLGLPCIATAVEGNVDVISHGHDGLLVPSDDAAALGHALARLAGDPHYAAALGRRARQTVERFAVERQACALLQIYQRLLHYES